MVGDPLALPAAELTLTPAADGFVARLAGLYPVVARLWPTEAGWSVALLGVRSDARPELLATSLDSEPDAAEAAVRALQRVRREEQADASRYRQPGGGPNRWYRDASARQPQPWNGILPDLTGSDEQLRRRGGGGVLGYLDATFPGLVNLAQHRPHYDPARGRSTDPNEHTAEVLAGLETSALPPRVAFLARTAVLYHDVGKGRDAYDPGHTLESARLAEPCLAAHGLTVAEQATVLLHIREHDLLGILSRGRITTGEAKQRLRLGDQPQNLAMHVAIATADISAIRGLRWVVDEGRLAEAHAALAAACGIA